MACASRFIITCTYRRAPDIINSLELIIGVNQCHSLGAAAQNCSNSLIFSKMFRARGHDSTDLTNFVKKMSMRPPRNLNISAPRCKAWGLMSRHPFQKLASQGEGCSQRHRLPLGSLYISTLSRTFPRRCVPRLTRPRCGFVTSFYSNTKVLGGLFDNTFKQGTLFSSRDWYIWVIWILFMDFTSIYGRGPLKWKILHIILHYYKDS